MVYKGHLLKDRGQTITATVAIKTLKGVKTPYLYFIVLLLWHACRIL